jgi:molecular chaperone DnaK
VLIGGPSKMPLVRQSVPGALGIPADLGTDPMTAVAMGAAIYAESRSWSAGVTQRKTSRASQIIEGDLVVKYDFPARAAENKATLRLTTEAPSHLGWRVRVEGFDGWSSGEVDVLTKTKIELPLGHTGENRFWVVLTGPQHQSQKNEISITRTFASSAGVPATLTICVAVEQDIGGSRREVLHPLVKKGTLLPCSGHEPFRAARSIVGGTEDYIDVKVFQAPDDVTDPSLTMLVGSFRLDANKHLQKGETLRQGQKIEIHWTMDDSGLLDARVEIPDLSISFAMGTFFSPKVGHKDFSGKDGKELADSLVADAGKAVDEVGEALGDTAWAEVSKLRGRLDTQITAMEQSSDPDARRQAAEESLAIRQEVARLRAAPANQNLVISRELAKVEEMYEDVSGVINDAALKDRIRQLSANARRLLDEHDHQQAESCINQIRLLVLGELLRRPEFLAMQFEVLSEERFASIDKTLHDKLVNVGRDTIRTEDWDGLRRVNSALTDNRFATAPVEPLTSRLVGLVRD